MEKNIGKDIEAMIEDQLVFVHKINREPSNILIDISLQQVFNDYLSGTYFKPVAKANPPAQFKVDRYRDIEVKWMDLLRMAMPGSSGMSLPVIVTSIERPF